MITVKNEVNVYKSEYGARDENMTMTVESTSSEISKVKITIYEISNGCRAPLAEVFALTCDIENAVRNAGNR